MGHVSKKRSRALREEKEEVVMGNKMVYIIWTNWLVYNLHFFFLNLQTFVVVL